jgi:hypothetical protein
MGGGHVSANGAASARAVNQGGDEQMLGAK